MIDKILTLLGFASKSGNLSYGMDASREAIKKGKAFLIITACDISDKSLKEIKFSADKNGTPVIKTEYTIEQLLHATGKRAGILSVNEKGFANSIKGGIANG